MSNQGHGRYYIAFDVETALFAPGMMSPPLVCLSWAMREFGTRGRIRKGLFDREAAIKWFRDRLLDDECVLIAHNAIFDIGVMVEEDPSLMPLVFRAYRKDRILCTKVHAKLDYIGRSRWQVAQFSLAALEKRLIKRDRSDQKSGKDAWRLFYGELKDVPLALWPEGAVEYAIDDAEGALLVQEALRDAPKTYPARQGEDWPDLFPQCRADWVMHLMATWGIITDPLLVPRVVAPLRQKVDALMEELFRKGIYGYKDSRRPERGIKKDMKLVQQLVYEAFNGDPPMTDGGSVATDKKTLAKSGHPDLMLLAEMSGPYKTLNTFVGIIESGVETPIHPRWNVLVNSGRTSCSGPNLQNQPRAPGIREAFIARPGRHFIQADYNAAEMRTLAQGLLNRVGPNELAKLYQADKYADAHLQVVTTSLGISYEEALARHKRNDPLVKLHRTMAKVANFGFAGGMSYMTLPEYALGMGVKDLMGVPLAIDIHGVPNEECLRASMEAQHIWMNTYPEMRPYFSMMKSAAKYEEPLVQDHSGRIRARGTAGYELGYCDRCNSVFQGLAADGIKAAAFDIAEEAYCDRNSPLWDSRFSAIVHDEIIMSSPIEATSDAAKRMSFLMEQGMSKVAPDVPHWAEACVMGKRWIKSAEPVLDDEGNLLRYDTSTDKWRKALESAGIELPDSEQWDAEVNNV